MVEEITKNNERFESKQSRIEQPKTSGDAEVNERQNPRNTEMEREGKRVKMGQRIGRSEGELRELPEGICKRSNQMVNCDPLFSDQSRDDQTEMHEEQRESCSSRRGGGRSSKRRRFVCVFPRVRANCLFFVLFCV